MMVLRDRWRWHATAAGRTLFGVFQGFIVRDSAAAGAIGESGGTGTAVATDSPRAARVPARFRLTRVDTLRTWRDGDCGRSHPPRW
ncbi:MAG TPA: hypothetical protein VLE53_12290 [Gemmatimonadaceae bacterium]|nr:hypothetical protein [Gemmatimonadaceae bacterium]